MQSKLRFKIVKLYGMKSQNDIVSDHNVLLGKPTIKGTRLSVDHIVGLLAQDWSDDQILENYPRLIKTI